ncbi:MAG TPA: aspartate/glutamate racemase family protein [Candidatus Eremiobacteraceae bacterium]|nr:aspartate/glutamate racemase family protein [Candidatus Eremiobacteraceae bacterium]
MNARVRHVGMIDSGLGGLTVLTALRNLLPDVDVTYFADTAHVPYGDRPLDEVALFGRQMIEWLTPLDPALIIVASGTTCAAFEASGGVAGTVRQLGIAELGATAGIRASKTLNIGVVATHGTIASGIFERKIHALQPAAIVTSVAAPALVPIVEGGEWNSERARTAVDSYMQPVRAANCDTLILGCTHFPHLSRWFITALQPSVAVVDPAEACAQACADALAGDEPGDGRLLFAVSGDVEDFARHALQLSGLVANDTRRVTFPAAHSTASSGARG